MSKSKVVVVASPGLTTNLLCEFLATRFDVVAVLLENPESNGTKLKRRFKKLPFFKVIAQLFFLTLVVPFLNRKAKKRIEQLVQHYGLTGKTSAGNNMFQIASVNSKETVQKILDHQPDLVFINGTRIIRKEILEALQLPVINIHVGITPAYRGIHGGYWALYHNDAVNFGVTLHHVDAGVDTGKIIAQANLKPAAEDNFSSYPILQFCEGLLLIEKNMERLTETLPVNTTTAKSEQHYHPGFGQYLAARMRRGIR